MADIKISDINFDGNDLFTDSENFMNDLSNDDMGLIQGGDWSTFSGACRFVDADEWSTVSDYCRTVAAIDPGFKKLSS
ncbi:conserved hypothetical protein [Hyella patelloides LEGE 07179]|uniref:Uncharacterized protein n=1 Tax=Hyella patelloides LEGE 07179 TaxID=945734 RepID=A0A563VUD5_9CYAN|nr:hypothetical protein [Hyella patelloides]VEP15086.1 conserved hypothetical protein [Hyella patelloides LEGE 07179]